MKITKVPAILKQLKASGRPAFVSFDAENLKVPLTSVCQNVRRNQPRNQRKHLSLNLTTKCLILRWAIQKATTVGFLFYTLDHDFSISHKVYSVFFLYGKSVVLTVISYKENRKFLIKVSKVVDKRQKVGIIERVDKPRVRWSGRQCLFTAETHWIPYDHGCIGEQVIKLKNLLTEKMTVILI